MCKELILKTTYLFTFIVYSIKEMGWENLNVLITGYQINYILKTNDIKNSIQVLKYH